MFSSVGLHGGFSLRRWRPKVEGCQSQLSLGHQSKRTAFLSVDHLLSATHHTDHLLPSTNAGTAETMRLAVLLLSVPLRAVVSAPAGGRASIAELGDFEILELPADFDTSHPALDIGAQFAALRRDPRAALPQLPAHVLASAIRIRGGATAVSSEQRPASSGNSSSSRPNGTAMVPIKTSAILERLTFHCDHNGAEAGRPFWWDAEDLGRQLENSVGLGRQFCCHFNYRDFRTTIKTHNTAAVEWAGAVGRCMSCKVIGYIVRVHTQLCGAGGSYRAGGIVVCVPPVVVETEREVLMGVR